MAMREVFSAAMWQPTPRPTAVRKKDLEEVLRINEERYRHVGERAVHDTLTRYPRDYVAYLRRELEQIARGDARFESVAEVGTADGVLSGGFTVQSGVFRRREEVRKTVSLEGVNAAGRIVIDQPASGKVVVLHPEENFVTHVFESCLWSCARAGATAALGVRQLLAGARTLTIIGAGRVGYYAALYATATMPFVSVTVHDKRSDRAERLARILEQGGDGGWGADVHVARNRADIGPTDVVILGTAGQETAYREADFDARLIVAAGAQRPHRRELDPALAGSGRIVVDHKRAATLGDLGHWRRSEWASANDLTELPTLFKSEATRSEAPAKRTFLFVAGSALYDNITAGYVLSQTRREWA